MDEKHKLMASSKRFYSFRLYLACAWKGNNAFQTNSQKYRTTDYSTTLVPDLKLKKFLLCLQFVRLVIYGSTEILKYVD